MRHAEHLKDSLLRRCSRSRGLDFGRLTSYSLCKRPITSDELVPHSQLSPDASESGKWRTPAGLLDWLN